MARQFSVVVGIGVENPKDLTPLYRFPSSREIMFIVLGDLSPACRERIQEIYVVAVKPNWLNNACKHTAFETPFSIYSTNYLASESVFACV